MFPKTKPELKQLAKADFTLSDDIITLNTDDSLKKGQTVYLPHLKEYATVLNEELVECRIRSTGQTVIVTGE